ncbi:MAG: hypothetical protein ACK5B9_01995 [Flavobacteriia bacterium]
MKTFSHIPVFASLIFVVFAFNKRSNNVGELEVITLEQALKENLLTATFQANGNYSGNSLACKMKNLKTKSYKIVIPAGTYFMAPSTDEQDLIIPQEEFFVLKTNESKSIVLNGYCCNLSNHAPTEDGKFTLIPSKAPKEMPKLLAFLKGKKYENHTLQDAIWAVTNKSSVTNVYGTDAKAVEALRKELFALTGQKEDWYQSPQQTTVNEDRSINRETASISGDLEYEAKKGSKVHTEVFSPEGTVKIKTDDKELTMSGTLSFHFKVEVQGWKKGKYQVKVIENSKVIKSYDFNV